jgi:predicted RNA-binding protein with RPS1 domain
LDGVESEDEAHNVERPARQQLKKKKAQGKDLSEFEVGSTVPGTIKSITNYGAFVDIGATTDGLLHISQLSTEFVGDVGEVVKEGQQVDVRIVNINTSKGQIGLSLISAAQDAAAQEAATQARDNRQNRKQSARRDDSPVLSALKEKGWDESTMVEGTVVSTVDFGCFVRVDASKLNPDCEGEFDGLVHISALQAGRVGSVTDVVSVDDKVQVRCTSIDGNKVSLTMLSETQESNKAEAAAASGAPVQIEGAKDWEEILVKFEGDMPTFSNTAVIEDRRK